VRYRAFLSYSHHDAAWARWLLRRLESYRVPARLVGTPGRDGPIPARLGAMFRDRDELPTAGDLGSTIREAIAESSNLIVICSPAAARSQWVEAEVRAFVERGSADRVFCFIVDGDPVVDSCFPSASIEDGREPLAADARPQGDGKERAFLKLVAGLLGVRFDDLVQREAQRRNRKYTIIAAAAVAGMAVTSTLAISAHVARNDAQRRQAQAEDLLGFMLGDLRQKLTKVGRLDLMRTVDDKATRYFAELDPRDISDAALSEQARSLTGIGQVRMEEGHLPEAMRAFQEAYTRTSALYERNPRDGQRLFDRAQAEYWIGFVAWQQDRFGDAETWLRRYRDSALQLAPMDRNNFDWQKEVAYGHHNLAVLQEARGHHAEAERAMKRELELFRGWVKARPKDTTLRFEQAAILSWLGTTSDEQGRDEESEAYFVETLREMSALRKIEPGNASFREEWLDNELLLLELRVKRGDFDGAREATNAANAEADALTKHDPTNLTWRSKQGLARYWRARLDGMSAPTQALPVAKEAERLLASVVKSDPKNTRVSAWLDRTRKLQLELSKPVMAVQ